jgi:tRNA pseudouridine38-40 synthase
LIDVEGNAFLRHMVRILVGTLAEVGAGLRHWQDVPRILASQQRRYAGLTAPAQGLTLKRVDLLWPGQRHPGLPLMLP